MSIMYITEFADVSRVGGDAVSMPSIPPTASQAITFSTVAQSAAFQNNTKVVRINVDGLANIAFGLNPTAVASTSMRMSAGATEYFDVSNVMGQGYKVSAITSPV
jgi:hypothetical protein